MSKRVLSIYLVIVLGMVAFFLVDYIVLMASVNDPDHVIKLEEFSYLGQKQDFTERKIEGDRSLHSYQVLVSRDQLDRLGDHWTLIVTRLRGNWHQVYLNDVQIGAIGSPEIISNHIWNDAYQFVLDPSQIKDQNVIRFETYSQYKIGFSTIPIVIANEEVGHTLFKHLKRFHSGFYIIAITGLLTLALVEVLLFIFTKYYGKSYSLMPLSILAIALYLFDYSIFKYEPLSPLVFKKILIMLLYLAVFIQDLSLSKLYKRPYIFKLGLFTLAFSALSFILSPSLVVLSNVYKVTNLLLLVNVLVWFLESSRHYLKHKDNHYLMLAIASMLLLLPGTIDVFVLAFNKGHNLRLTVYGILFYSIAVLIVAIIHYIEYQKKLFHDSEQLKKDKEHLEKALVTDDLTGLGNHRGFYEAFRHNTQIRDKRISLLYVDIDKFRAINHTLGHSTGDQIVKRLSEVILDHSHSYQHVYRYGGEEFVILCDHEVYPDPVQVAEDIRQAVLKDKGLTDLSGFYPVSVSVGLATYPLDAVDLKMVVRKAERANDYAKVSGRNRVCVYERSIESKLESMAQQQLKDNLILDFVLTLAAAIDLKDVYTGKHSEEVSRYAMLIADGMDLDNDTKASLRTGSLLHDLGKIAIPDMILQKPGRLTEEEYVKIQDHTRTGSKLIEEIIDDPLVIACVRNHHERYDGGGYPDGLRGDRIPLVARIVGVADAYHAMVSDRSYRQGIGRERALAELHANKGSQFDPLVVEIFEGVIGD